MPRHPTTIQIRLTAESREEAEQACAELRAQLGTSRVMLQTPRVGRDKRGDGRPPWFVYGTFQFLPEDPARVISEALASSGPRSARQLPATGPTRRLKRRKP